MYKSEGEERLRPQLTTNPSFSSSLLDEIYRSIDVGSTKSPGHSKFYRDKKLDAKPRSRRCIAQVDDDHKSTHRRQEFVELEKKFLLLQQQRKRDPDFDQDPLFFNSVCFSSSDADSVYRSKPRSSSLPPPISPYKPAGSAPSAKPGTKTEFSAAALFHGRQRDQKPVHQPTHRRQEFVELEKKFLLLQQQRKHDPDFDQDPLFFSSGSNSSDSSSVGFSSSDADSTHSCSWPRSASSLTLPIRPYKPAGSAPSAKQGTKTEVSATALLHGRQREINGHNNHSHSTDSVDGVLESKLRAINVKKVKQPISPGRKLASFIHTLFAAGTPKRKSKNNPHDEGKSKSEQASTCSSATSSVSKSCLSKKDSPSTRGEKGRNRDERTVRFCQEQSVAVQSKVPFSSGRMEDDACVISCNRIGITHGRINDDDDDDDCMSCSSSELFELDHLAVIGRDDVFGGELPVYETTHKKYY